GADAGVVHEHVDVETTLGDGRDEIGAGRRVGEIAAMTSVRTPKSPLNSSASSLSCASRRATNVTPWPRRASWRASPTPMPEDAPVTSAVESGSGGGRATAAAYGPA